MRIAVEELEKKLFLKIFIKNVKRNLMKPPAKYDFFFRVPPQSDFSVFQETCTQQNRF